MSILLSSMENIFSLSLKQELILSYKNREEMRNETVQPEQVWAFTQILKYIFIETKSKPAALTDTN